MKKIIHISFLLLVGVVASFAQYGELRGKVLDENGKPLAFATVALYKGETILRNISTDYDGVFSITSIEPGTYDLAINYTGYPQKRFLGIQISPNKIATYDISYDEGEANEGGQVGPDIIVTPKKPIVNPYEMATTFEKTAEEIAQDPNRNILDQAAQCPGCAQKDAGEKTSTNGGRANAGIVMVDGIPTVNGMLGVSDTEIELMQVLSSGIPAEYGDVTGSVINIITKGPASKFSANAQLESSQYLDAFGATTADLGFSGPIIRKAQVNPESKDTIKDDDGQVKYSTIMGYRLSGRYMTNLDNRPSAYDWYQLTDEKRADILANPLLPSPNGIGRINNAETITADDILRTKVRQNARNSSAMFNGKIDFRPSPEYYFVAGFQGQMDWGNNASVGNQLINSSFNPYYQNSTWRAYGRFRHYLGSSKKDTTQNASDSIPKMFQNFSYEIQLDYSRSDGKTYDPRFGHNYWEYGYVGKIDRSLVPVVGIIDTNYILNSNGDTLSATPVFGHAFNYINFDGYSNAGNRGFDNGLASYNNAVDFNNISDMEQMEVINGRFTTSANSVFGLFNNAYNTGNQSTKSNNSQLRANIKANFDLVDIRRGITHSIQIGGVYEQRVFRSYNVMPFALWTLADQSANTHISNSADAESPMVDEQGNPVQFFDPVTQRYYYQNQSLIRDDENGNPVPMSAFGANIRAHLGKNPNDWVNVHEMSPSDMKLDWFEATTLIQGSQQVLNYYGYNYLGDAIGTSTTFNEFFTQTDENGRKTRPVAPFAPIYVAGYIQDKFKYKDMIFSLGVRFDAYDANTKVLKDPYSVTGFYSASEIEKSESGYNAALDPDYVRPSNIGDDYAVYVNSNSPDASIIGYRDGEQWYNSNGVPVNAPSELGTIIIPALRGFSSAETDPQGENYDPNLAFRDYKSTLIVMPRISFAFPIGKMANFYATYDILAMRPPEATLATAMTYYNFRNNASLMANPNLRSQRTISYEVGYQQGLNDFSRIKFSLLYREERDLIQARQYILAYPISYTSFGNDDFSTVKSFRFEYELRPDGVKNKNLRLLANYTLQFAEGTGSSPTSSLRVAATELKYIFPLDFDQRHTFHVSMDYRFGSGADYNGPCMGRFSILENMGANISMNMASGTPYTRKEIPAGYGTSFNEAITDGSINGARMPWNFRVDMRIDRDIVIGRKSKNPIHCNIYLRVQNVFNTRNVLNVYAATGDPLNDGFLTMQDSPGVGLASSRGDSYQMLYDLRMRDPFNISRPRRMFLGTVFNF